MNYISVFDIYTILPELFFFLACCIILLYGTILSLSVKFGYPLISNKVNLLIFQIFIFGFFLIINCPLFIMYSWHYFLISDFYTHQLKIILVLGILIWIILSLFYEKQEHIYSFEYWILILLCTLTFLLLLQSYDLLSMYLLIEFQSLIFYILTSFKRTSEFSTEAGLKYFILGAFSSSLLLFGSSLLYSLTGLTNFGDFTKFTLGFFDQNFLLTLGITTSLIFLVVALLFKLGAAPFHMWSPDVYEGAPTLTTAFLIIMPKISIIVLFIRLFFISFQDYFIVIEKIILISALLSLVIGAFGALIQKKWKRFIAYSSINHIGFIVLSLITGDNSSFFSTIFYIIIYSITMIIIFTFIIFCRLYSNSCNYQIRYLEDLTRLAAVNPILSLTLSVILFSMAGIPPLAGFFAKMIVLLNILKNEVYGIAILAILISCLACYYYIRIIKIMYFSISLYSLPIMYPIDKLTSLLLGIFLFILVFLFLDLELIFLFLQQIIV